MFFIQLQRKSDTASQRNHPAVQNMLLAARALGLGATRTTLYLQFKQEAEAALGLTAGVHSVCPAADRLSARTVWSGSQLIGERVQNLRCRQPEGSGSSGKLCPKSITVTTGPPSGFKTSPRPPKKCQPIRPTAATIVTPPIRRYRARHGIEKPARILAKTKNPSPRALSSFSRSEVCLGHITAAFPRPK